MTEPKQNNQSLKCFVAQSIYLHKEGCAQLPPHFVQHQPLVVSCWGTDLFLSAWPIFHKGHFQNYQSTFKLLLCNTIGLDSYFSNLASKCHHLIKELEFTLLSLFA